MFKTDVYIPQKPAQYLDTSYYKYKKNIELLARNFNLKAVIDQKILQYKRHLFSLSFIDPKGQKRRHKSIINTINSKFSTKIQQCIYSNTITN